MTRTGEIRILVVRVVEIRSMEITDRKLKIRRTRRVKRTVLVNVFEDCIRWLIDDGYIPCFS